MLKKSASVVLDNREAYLVGGRAGAKTFLYLFEGHTIGHTL